jgi:hypothetical protein
VDAEVYTLIAQRMKRQSPMTNTVMVTLANGRAPSGYIPDDASFSHNSFQVLGSRLKACNWPPWARQDVKERESSDDGEAGGMTATARADIGARFQARPKSVGLGLRTDV